jgi:bifunctional dethiobiotin synthetase / adenosylmethionine---8-amino-7-oxononanoate aminotransferase
VLTINSDPLFQYSLIQVIRENPQLFNSSAPSSSDSWSGLPVIFDETFTGSYRLGRSSSASLIDTQPDISIRSLNSSSTQCVALASPEISQSSKPTPVSQETSTALTQFKKLEEQGKWNNAKGDWGIESTGSAAEGHWSMWSTGFLSKISLSDVVKSCMALGSVLVVKVHAKDTGMSTPLLSKEGHD